MGRNCPQLLRTMGAFSEIQIANSNSNHQTPHSNLLIQTISNISFSFILHIFYKFITLTLLTSSSFSKMMAQDKKRGQAIFTAAVGGMIFR